MLHASPKSPSHPRAPAPVPSTTPVMMGTAKTLLEGMKTGLQRDIRESAHSPVSLRSSAHRSPWGPSHHTLVTDLRLGPWILMGLVLISEWEQFWQTQSFPLNVTLSPMGNGFLQPRRRTGTRETKRMR